jgi:hypothetical protein
MRIAPMPEWEGRGKGERGKVHWHHFRFISGLHPKSDGEKKNRSKTYTHVHKRDISARISSCFAVFRVHFSSFAFRSSAGEIEITGRGINYETLQKKG